MWLEAAEAVFSVYSQAGELAVVLTRPKDVFRVETRAAL